LSSSSTEVALDENPRLAKGPTVKTALERLLKF